jgi:hypothetical protein
MSNPLNKGRTRTLHQGLCGCNRLALFAIGQSNFEQLVLLKGRFHMLNDTRRDPMLTNDHHRLEVMGLRAKESKLFSA